eukprot:SAG11_NODE_179_length_13323_cov_27.934286_9_plen_575_part_00
MARKRMRQKALAADKRESTQPHMPGSGDAKRTDDSTDVSSADDETRRIAEREVISQIRVLEQEVKQSKAKVNNLVALLTLLTGDDVRVIKATMHALRRLFTGGSESLAAVTRTFMSAEPRSGEPAAVAVARASGAGAEAAKAASIFDAWVCKQYAEFKRLLLEHLRHEDNSVQILALVVLMQLVKAESAAGFATELFGRTVRSLYEVGEGHYSGENLKVFVAQFLNEYDDIRYHTLKCLKVLLTSWAREPAAPSALQRVLATLLTLTMPDASIESLDSFWVPPAASAAIGAKKRQKKDANGELKDVALRGGRAAQCRSHRKAFGDCWMQLLRLPGLTPATYRRVLLNMHSQILPHMPHPLLLSDFLTDAYNQGGAVSMLALHGLFILMSKHGLEYPNFYPRLYALIKPDILHVGHRDQFFQLMDLFLTSRALPVYIVASFLKRMARVALVVPPSGVLLILPFMYNLLQRHPSAKQMIHRPLQPKSAAGQSGVSAAKTSDPFIATEDDPAKSQALESSLWELEALSRHFYPPVAKFSKVFETNMTKPKYELSDFVVSERQRAPAGLCIAEPPATV